MLLTFNLTQFAEMTYNTAVHPSVYIPFLSFGSYFCMFVQPIELWSKAGRSKCFASTDDIMASWMSKGCSNSLLFLSV